MQWEQIVDIKLEDGFHGERISPDGILYMRRGDIYFYSNEIIFTFKGLETAKRHNTLDEVYDLSQHLHQKYKDQTAISRSYVVRPAP